MTKFASFVSNSQTDLQADENIKVIKDFLDDLPENDDVYVTTKVGCSVSIMFGGRIYKAFKYFNMTKSCLEQLRKDGYPIKDFVICDDDKKNTSLRIRW